MSNLTPEPRPDKNGKVVTRHVKSTLAREGIVKNPDHRTSGITVKPSTPFITVNPEPFNELVAKPTEQDVASAIKMTSHFLDGNIKGRGWKDVMGSTARSAESSHVYREHQVEYIKSLISDPRLVTENDRILTELSIETYKFSRESAHARAFDEGIETPYDRYFEDIWLNAEGCREADYLADYDEAIAHYGAADAVKKEEYRRGMSEIQEIIRTRGRTSYRNITHAEKLFMEAEANV